MIENRDEQEENTLFPIEVTLFGSVIDVRDEHEENALFPIEVTLFDNVIDDRDEHEENALFPIEVTLFGNVIEVIFFIPRHKFEGICFTLSPKLNDVICPEISLKGWKIADPTRSEKSSQFFAFHCIDVRDVQPENAPPPIEVTLLGIMIDVSDLQPENAPPPIEVTLLGIMIDVSDLQPENALFPIEVILLGIEIDLRFVKL